MRSRSDLRFQRRYPSAQPLRPTRSELADQRQSTLLGTLATLTAVLLVVVVHRYAGQLAAALTVAVLFGVTLLCYGLLDRRTEVRVRGPVGRPYRLRSATDIRQAASRSASLILACDLLVLLAALLAGRLDWTVSATGLGLLAAALVERQLLLRLAAR